MSKKSPMMWMAVALGGTLLVIIVLGIVFLFSLSREVREAKATNDELLLANEQLQLTNEFESVNAEFRQYENAAQRLTNDTIFAKYTAAKQKVEQLMDELKSEKVKSQARIKELQSEIATLKGLLRHYVAQIDSLSKENANLKSENLAIRSQNAQLSTQVREQTQKNAVLSERMTLAEKLNVTGLSLTALKKNGKVENNVTKARQLMVTFTIPQNNSTPVGTKTFFLRITNPEGQLLGNGGTFDFEGGNVACTAKKAIEYAGDELAGVTIYYDVDTTLTPGEYTVELFTDGYRVASRKFVLKK